MEEVDVSMTIIPSQLASLFMNQQNLTFPTESQTISCTKLSKYVNYGVSVFLKNFSQNFQKIISKFLPVW